MIRKNLFLLIIIFISVLNVNSQISIIGQLKDTTNEFVPAATVMLLNSKDSALVNYTTSDSKGIFSFKNIKRAKYLLKISHVAFMPYQKTINPTEEEKEINLGLIKLSPIANFLMEVVIREAKAPIFIKGDTVEYDATTFKIPPGSTVEDLLKRLPGIEVDANGGITTMGKDVKTVYVDGKAFFGNDPTTVTQNLDAAAVKKVQVYNETTEQEKITGIKDNNKEKVMNLELKDEYKKGYFGKASVGYGWGENAANRWLAKGNFNYFTEKQQLSFMGYGNNINQSNVNWSDYSEFKGQSMRTGWDSGDFGFGGYGRRYFSYGYGYGGDGSGFSNNAGGGVNYNFYDKKIKFNASYFYTRTNTFSDTYSNRQTFLSDSIFWRIDTTGNDNTRNNHSFSTRFEYDFDSTNNLVLRADVSYSTTDRSNITTQLFQTSLFDDINLNSMKNDNGNNDFGVNALGIYTHKFKKKGRTFAISGNYDFSNGKSAENIDNLNEFYNLSPIEQIKFIVKNDEIDIDHTIKASILYVEPLSKQFTLQTFYNFRTSLRTNNNESRDPNNNSVDSLYLNYKNNLLYNRVGASLNFAYNGINIQAGGAFQNLQLNGISRQIATENKSNFPYSNGVPYFEADFELTDNLDLDLGYEYAVEEPNISYLFPMPNLSNNLYKTIGNPELDPERSHDASVRLSYWNQASMFNISLNGNASFSENNIVYNQTTNFVDSIGYVTISKPANVKGGNSFSTYLWSNFPIVKTILTMNVSLNGSISNSPVFINEMENNTNSKNAGGSLGINITAGEKLSFNAGASASATFTKYSINTDKNQNYMRYSANAGFKWQVFKKTFLEGNYSFSNYNNSKLDFNQNINNLNVSIRQVIGAKNQFEIRIAAMDLLNQNQYIRQIASVNYIEYRQSPTLARYYLLTVAYNLRGFEISNKSRNYF
ncbi:MAG: TonB-dependent receptor family protein [Bacteroidales bacterium]|jgi:hypothetical protein|nr:TonB-dependent receptor family protein [Bacteroidales bacterium]